MINYTHKLLIILVLFSIPLLLGAKKDISTNSPVKVQADEISYFRTEKKNTFNRNVVVVIYKKVGFEFYKYLKKKKKEEEIKEEELKNISKAMD